MNTTRYIVKTSSTSKETFRVADGGIVRGVKVWLILSDRYEDGKLVFGRSARHGYIHGPRALADEVAREMTVDATKRVLAAI